MKFLILTIPTSIDADSLLDVLPDNYIFALLDIVRLLLTVESSKRHMLYQENKILHKVFNMLGSFNTKSLPAKLMLARVIGNLLFDPDGAQYFAMQESVLSVFLDVIECGMQNDKEPTVQIAVAAVIQNLSMHLRPMEWKSVKRLLFIILHYLNRQHQRQDEHHGISKDISRRLGLALFRICNCFPEETTSILTKNQRVQSIEMLQEGLDPQLFYSLRVSCSPIE